MLIRYRIIVPVRYCLNLLGYKNCWSACNFLGGTQNGSLLSRPLPSVTREKLIGCDKYQFYLVSATRVIVGALVAATLGLSAGVALLACVAVSASINVCLRVTGGMDVAAKCQQT